MFKVLLRHLSAVDVSHEEGEGVEDEGAASTLICELLCELTLLICALKTWRLADIAWQHTSAYVSIRQHTSYARSRLGDSQIFPGRSGSVSICTFVLGKQVKFGFAWSDSAKSASRSEVLWSRALKKKGSTENQIFANPKLNILLPRYP